MHTDVSVVVPVYNNARTLIELHERIRRALPNAEIVLVDDASKDGSLVVMKSLRAEIVALARRQGQNAAIRAGLRRARGLVCCVLDADLEDPPEALPRLIEPVRDGVARVAFSMREGHVRWTSWMFRRVMRVIFPSLPPRACLCFAIDADAAAALARHALAHDYLVAVIGAMRLPAVQVPIMRELRPARSSGYAGFRRTRHGLRMLAAAVRIRLHVHKRGFLNA